jgi:hypothetical protein
LVPLDRAPTAVSEPAAVGARSGIERQDIRTLEKPFNIAQLLDPPHAILPQ